MDAAVVGFPGPYIRNLATWDELARVLRQDGVVVTLVGGMPGPGTRRSAVGRLIGWMVYGRLDTEGCADLVEHALAPLLRHPSFFGYWHGIETDQGVALVWLARKRWQAPAGMI